MVQLVQRVFECDGSDGDDLYFAAIVVDSNDYWHGSRPRGSLPALILRLLGMATRDFAYCCR